MKDFDKAAVLLGCMAFAFTCLACYMTQQGYGNQEIALILAIVAGINLIGMWVRIWKK